MIEGDQIYDLIRELFPICRSITGDGVRQTLAVICQHVPISIYEVPSGAPAFSWTVPDEWNIRDAYVLDPDGRKVIDFQSNNLHVMGYSEPVDAEMPLSELQEHLHSRPDMPDAIPYVTSYYERRWGFCLSHNERRKLRDGIYRVFIDSTLEPGHLTYGDLVIPGDTSEEVLLSTYVCHPSLANDNLSGPAVATYLAKWLMSEPRRYTYRIVFVPETIGALVYLNRRRYMMKANTVAGFMLTCLGDDRGWSLLSGRLSDETLAERVALNVLEHSPLLDQEDVWPWPYEWYSFLDRGSDERHYCSPGMDLPVVSIMRSKYGTYPEYHTSLDNLDLVKPEALQESYDVLKTCLRVLELNRVYCVKTIGEPCLRGIYPTLSTFESARSMRDTVNLLAYCDGDHDLVSIGEIINAPVWDLQPIVEKLLEMGVLYEV